MIQNRKAGMLASFGVVFISGIAYISKDIIVDYFNPIIVVALQLIIMTVFFTAYNLLKKIDLKVAKKDLVMIVISGLFGTTFFNLLSISSIQYIGGTVSSLLFGFAAVFSLISEFVFLKRKMTKLSIISVLISLAGVYILMGLKTGDLTNTSLRGYFLSLLSIIAWVMFCFLSDRISNQCEKTVILNYQAVVGMITTLPFLMLNPVSLPQLLDFNVIINLLILGVLNTSVAYLLCIYAIRHIGVTFSNLMMNFFPVVTVLVTFIIYGTIPGMNQIIGGIIILFSVILLNKDQKIRLVNRKSSMVSEEKNELIHIS